MPVGKATLKIKNGHAVSIERGVVEQTGRAVVLYHTPADGTRKLLLSYVMNDGETVRFNEETGEHLVEF